MNAHGSLLVSVLLCSACDKADNQPEPTPTEPVSASRTDAKADAKADAKVEPRTDAKGEAPDGKGSRLPDFPGKLDETLLSTAHRAMFDLQLEREAELAELRRVLGEPTFAAFEATAWGLDAGGRCVAYVHLPTGSKLFDFDRSTGGAYQECRTRLGIGLPEGTHVPEDGRTTPDIVRKNIVASKHADWIGKELTVSGAVGSISPQPADKTKTLTVVDDETRKEALACVVAIEADVPPQGADVTVAGTLTTAGELADCRLATQ